MKEAATGRASACHGLSDTTANKMARRNLYKILLCLVITFTPAFSQQLSVTYRIREEQETGTYVGNVARDSLIYNQFNQSEFQRLEYRIPSTISKLSIDSKTSTVRTAQVLDREKECNSFLGDQPCTMTFDVSVYRVSNDGSFDLLRIIRVKLELEDINDNAPEFPSDATTLDVPESLEVNQVLRTSGAIDRDSGVNNTVQTYSLEGGMDYFGLQVIPNPGGMSSDLGIVLKKKLDREEKSLYKLRIIAEDGGFPKLTGSVDILINVIDVNDNRPLFTKVSFDTEVPEDRPVGSTILTLSAEDPDTGDNGRLTFTFSSPPPTEVTEYLAINATSGEVYLIKDLDYEKVKSFRFSATVSDNGTPSESSQISVLVTVQDVNDNAPQIEITLPSSYVKESIGVGKYIAHVSLSDLDSSENSKITCVIANDNFMLQKFEGSDSILKVNLKRHLDYEKRKIEVVNVSCQDGGQPPMTNTSSFIIHVQDVNDNAPVFTRSTYQASIQEDNYIGKFVAQVQAVDPDEGNNGEVYYSLASNPGNKFQINRVSGVIKAMQKLDREEIDSYELVVVAKDRGTIPISSSVSVTVLVADLNDNPPYFIMPHFEMRIQENRPKHSVVDTVFARDPDTASDNHLRFKFTSNFSYADVFAIDRPSGNIYTLASLDREIKDTYTFDVMVYDDSEPKFLDVTRVTVVVTDDNDNKPNITFPSEFNNTFSFIYTQPAGSVLLTVESEDIDAGENASVKFSILQGNTKRLFFINAVNGELFVAKPMNIYDAGNYKLVILARDGGQSYLESLRDINIIITVANGTASYLEEDDDNANIAIVIALVCITVVLAMAVLITICIIRRIDRERKHHNNTKVEEENIYKQQTTAETPISTPSKDNFENEIEKLKRKIKRDMSFVVEDDMSPLDSSDLTNKSSTFSTFKNTTAGSSDQKNLSTPQAHSSVLQNTLSPSEGNVKRVHYMDKGLDIDKLTTTAPPPRSQPSSSAYHSGRGSHWSGSRAQSPRSSVIKCPVEDAASHSSGSTSDSGRGGSSEEGDGHGHAHAVVVAIGDADPPTSTYPTSAKLMTFGSPRSNSSSSGTSHQPRSLSTSLNSETARKRLWGDSSSPAATSTTISGTNLSSRLSSDSPFQLVGIAETSDNYKPNISFSDDSVTANATAGNSLSLPSNSSLAGGLRSADIKQSPNRASSSSNLLNTGTKSSDALHSPPKPMPKFSSTQRPNLMSYPNNNETPYRLLSANISRIPNADGSTRHGMYVDGATGSVGSPRSQSYANANRFRGTDKSRQGNNSINNNYNGSNPNHSYAKLGNSANGSQYTRQNLLADETQSTSVGEPYSLADLKDVLDEASTAASTQQDDDNTTTTSGSYTINAEDLCQEIDHLFFNDIVV